MFVLLLISSFHTLYSIYNIKLVLLRKSISITSILRLNSYTIYDNIDSTTSLWILVFVLISVCFNQSSELSTLTHFWLWLILFAMCRYYTLQTLELFRCSYISHLQTYTPRLSQNLPQLPGHLQKLVLSSNFQSLLFFICVVLVYK